MTMGQGVIGRVVVDGGGKLPLMPKLTPASPDVPMAVQLAWRPTTLSPAAAALAARGSALAGMLFTELAGGYFIVPATAGEYQLMADTLPFGFYLKSASYSPETNLLQVTLTTTPPSAPPGVKISGRITGLSGSGDVRGLVNMQMSTPNAFGLTEKRVGMALVGRDGTFEVSHVPPGVVVINVDSLGGATPSSFSTRLTVGDRDMFIEYRVSVSEPAESVPRVSPGAVPPAAPITVVVPDVSAPPQPAR
jgi:hypothetical protein